MASGPRRKIDGMGNEPWTWDWDAVAALAGGAAALLSVIAIIVAGLAARASARAATAAERQLAAQTTPVVIEVPRGGDLPQEERVWFPDGTEIPSPVEGQVVFSASDGDYARCSIPIQNVGTGIGQITRAYLDFEECSVEFLAPGEEDPPGVVTSRARPTHIWLPPGGRARLATLVSEEEEDQWQWMKIIQTKTTAFAQIRILFSDASGARSFTTLLHLRRAPNQVNSWRLYHQWTRPVS